jgi:hypothetical protein
MSIKIDFTFDEYQIAKLTQIPELLRLGPAERCLKAMAKPIAERAHLVGPRYGPASTARQSALLAKSLRRNQVATTQSVPRSTGNRNQGASPWLKIYDSPTPSPSHHRAQRQQL